MKLGIDIGYNAVKAYDGIHKLITFPSVVGTADVSRFTAGGISHTNAQLIRMADGTRWMYGEEALEMSRIISRPEDRSWYLSHEYHVLLTAALRDLLFNVQLKKNETLQIVTGLPVMFYNDKKELEQIFVQDHGFLDEEGNTITYSVSDCRVIPQPFGTLLNLALDTDGDIDDPELARGMIGVIDCGGKTTNLLTSSKMREVARMTTSVNVGGWDIVRSVREKLNTYYPNLDLRDSEITKAIIEHRVKMYGNDYSISEMCIESIEPFADTIIASATQLWNSGASIDRILLTGGASAFVYPFIKSKYPHVTHVQEPIYSNVVGYYKFAKRIFKE